MRLAVGRLCVQIGFGILRHSGGTPGREALSLCIGVLQTVSEGDPERCSCAALADALTDHLAHLPASPLAGP